MRPYVRDTKPPSCPHFSSVTGQEITTDAFGLEYWIDNFLLPVKFNTAVRNILASDPNNVFIEIGPHPALRTPVHEILRDVLPPGSSSACEYVTTLERQQDGNHSLAILAGRLFSLNVDIQHLGDTIIPRARVILDLPAYPWHHHHAGAVHWHEPLNAARFKQRRHPRHPLLGSRVLEGNDIEPAWRNMLDLKEACWLFDHVVDGSMVYPATAYVAMAGEAVRQVAGGELAYTVRDVSFSTGLVLFRDKRVELYTRLIPEDTMEGGEDGGATWYNFKIMSSDGDHWVSHCTGSIRSGAQVSAATGVEKLVALGHDKASSNNNSLARHIDTDSWYRGASKIGVDWNGMFRGLENMTASVVAKEAAASVFDSYEDTVAYATHPAMLDQLLQINLVALTNGLLRNFDKIYLPTRIGRLAVFANQELQMRVFGRETDSTPREDEHENKNRSFEAVMLSEQGRPVAMLQDLSVSELPLAKRRGGGKEDKLLGSYFTCDTDITMVDSISRVTLTSGPNPDRTPPSYEGGNIEEIRRAVYLFGWKYPDAEVLEIGDGGLDVTSVVLSALRPDPRRRYFRSYTYACTGADTIAEAEAGLAAQGLADTMVVSAEDMSLVVKGVDLVVASLSVGG
jgi:acyl transferase domain-containing protein